MLLAVWPWPRHSPSLCPICFEPSFPSEQDTSRTSYPGSILASPQSPPAGLSVSMWQGHGRGEGGEGGDGIASVCTRVPGKR